MVLLLTQSKAHQTKKQLTDAFYTLSYRSLCWYNRRKFPFNSPFISEIIRCFLLLVLLVLLLAHQASSYRLRQAH